MIAHLVLHGWQPSYTPTTGHVAVEQGRVRLLASWSGAVSHYTAIGHKYATARDWDAFTEAQLEGLCGHFLVEH